MNNSGSNGPGQGYGVNSLNQWQYASYPVSLNWEYQTLPRTDVLGISLLDLQALNEAGAGGWEVCLIVRDTYLMKRKVYRQAVASTQAQAARSPTDASKAAA